MRVPLTANWPGRIVPGTVVRDLVDTTDFVPTIAEAVGFDLPNDIPFDGGSFLPQTVGRVGQPREWLYSWYWPNQQSAYNNRSDPPVEFARTHQYKLFGDGRFFELDGRFGEK